MSNKVTVYRIQDGQGRGPFKPGFSHRWVVGRPDHDNLRPWAEEVGVAFLARASKNYHFACGCQTTEHLQRWFTKEEYATLLRFGYRAVKIEADAILAETKTQLVFECQHPFHLVAEPFDLYES